MAGKKKLVNKVAGMLGSTYRTLSDEERTELFSELMDRRIFGFKPVVRVWFDYDNRGHVWDEVGEMGGSEGYYYSDILEPLINGEIISAMPYFRPIGSMTEDEREEYAEMFCLGKEVDYDVVANNKFDDEVYGKDEIFRWFYGHNLDMWNLCERGLARPVFSNLGEFVKCKKRVEQATNEGKYAVDNKPCDVVEEDEEQMIPISEVYDYLFETFHEYEDRDGHPYVACVFDSLEELVEDFRNTFKK